MPDISPLEFRRVLGHLPTGVTVLAAYRPDDEPIGMAANSVTSVSLSPPMVLLCPAKSSTTWPGIRAAGRFCVNVMAEHHEPLCRRFAARGSESRFAGVSWHRREAGPGLDEAVAWLDCEIDSEHDAGDHTVVIANVRGVQAAEHGAPLVFFKGKYGTFA